VHHQKTRGLNKNPRGSGGWFFIVFNKIMGRRQMLKMWWASSKK